jgi:hypothetical protein
VRLLPGPEDAHRWGPALAIVPWMMAAVVLACMVTDCGQAGDQRTIARGRTALPCSIESRPLTRYLDDLNGALQSLRDADPGRDLPTIYGVVRSDGERLLKAFAVVSARYEEVVAAGQRRLNAGSSQEQDADPAEEHDLRAQGQGDLAMAMESLLMCRMSYVMASASYRAQLARVMGTLDRHLDLSSIRTATPAITILLEDEAEVRSIVSDAAAKSRAVIALLDAQRPLL